MPKRSQLSRFQEKLRRLANKSLNADAKDEGKWKVTFVFDGKTYTKTHQLSEFEVKHMKDLCVTHGDLAADQLIWRAAVKGVGMVSENVMAQAGLDYVASHHKRFVGEAANQTPIDASKHVWPEDVGPVDPPSPMDSEDEGK